MMSDSACVMMLQLCPALSSACDATAKPRPSASSSITSGAEPEAYDVSQLAPCVSTSLLFHCFCGAHGCHGFFGCQSTAMAYWSRSEKPTSLRTMNGTVVPFCVVVLARSLGGLSGLYALKLPPNTDL